MTIRHYRIFVTVAECKNMHKAADILHISQPSISQAIKDLESFYHVQLFHRLSQKIYLTETGEQILPYAKHALDTFETLEMAMKNAGRQKLLRIGASISVGTTILLDIIDRFQREFPEVEIQVMVNNTARIEKAILDSELDIAIVEAEIQNGNVVKEKLCTDELVLLAGKQHPFFSKQEIVLEELNEQVLLSREKESSKRNQFEQLLNHSGIRIERRWRCNNTETIKQAAIRGKGLAILSNLLVKGELENGDLRVLPVKGVHIERNIQIVYHKDKYVSDTMENFIGIAKGLFHSCAKKIESH